MSYTTIELSHHDGIATVTFNRPPVNAQNRQSRDELIKSIHEKVLRLPAKILQEARDRTQQDDLEGAAEYYVIYLNATPGNASPERDEATKFLHDHFNVSLAQASPSTSHQL